MLRTKAAAAADADMETATDRHRHSHWPDFAYQCNAIVVLLLLLLLDWLICSQLASLLLHPICNLQHNLCSTTEKWTYWKMTVKRRPPKQAAATAGAATAWWTYICTYVQCLPSSSCHIYFWSSHTKCLASWDYFFAAALPSYSASCCTLPLPLPQGGMQLVSIIKRQRIKLNAYICFGMRSNCRAMSAMRFAMYVCAWPKRPERMLSYSPNELRISTRSWYLDA